MNKAGAGDGAKRRYSMRPVGIRATATVAQPTLAEETLPAEPKPVPTEDLSEPKQPVEQKAEQKPARATKKHPRHKKGRTDFKPSERHLKLLNKLTARAAKQGKEGRYYYSELIGGLLELIEPFADAIDFGKLQAERGSWSADGTERIKAEFGNAFQQAAVGHLLNAIGEGTDPALAHIAGALAPEARQRIARSLLLVDGLDEQARFPTTADSSVGAAA